MGLNHRACRLRHQFGAEPPKPLAEDLLNCAENPLSASLHRGVSVHALQGKVPSLGTAEQCTLKPAQWRTENEGGGERAHFLFIVSSWH